MGDRYILAGLKAKERPPVELELQNYGNCLVLRAKGFPSPCILAIDKATGRISRRSHVDPGLGLELDDDGKVVIH